MSLKVSFQAAASSVLPSSSVSAGEQVVHSQAATSTVPAATSSVPRSSFPTLQENLVVHNIVVQNIPANGMAADNDPAENHLRSIMQAACEFDRSSLVARLQAGMRRHDM